MTADTAWYGNDTVWYEKFPGLYIVSGATSSDKPAIFSTSLSATGLTVYGRSHDSTDLTLIKDTVTATYLFYTENYVVNSTISANKIEHDYTGSLVASAGVNDTLPTSATQQTMYVEGMGGVAGYLRLNDQLVQSLGTLQNKVVGGGYSSVAINQALVYINMEGNTAPPAQITPFLNTAVERLGMYYNIKNVRSIPDYDYYTEYYIQQNSSSDYMLPYNGYLNRSNGYYSMDITSYMQRMWKDYQSVGGDVSRVSNREIFLSPSAYELYSFGQVSLQGYGSSDPIKIVLVYTLVK